MGSDTLVLVVEDDADIRRLIQIVLEEELGVVAVVATDGGEALRHILRARPALVVLDILMPNVTGLELLRCLKANSTTRDIPVIAVSAVRHALEKAREAGCTDYLDKPFDLDALIGKVRKHLPRAPEAKAA